MKISHRAAADFADAGLAVQPLRAGSDKAPRLSCCCRLSELMPLVRQAHDAARAARLAAESLPAEAA